MIKEFFVWPWSLELGVLEKQGAFSPCWSCHQPIISVAVPWGPAAPISDPVNSGPLCRSCSWVLTVIFVLSLEGQCLSTSFLGYLLGWVASVWVTLSSQIPLNRLLPTSLLLKSVNLSYWTSHTWFLLLGKPRATSLDQARWPQNAFLRWNSLHSEWRAAGMWKLPVSSSWLCDLKFPTLSLLWKTPWRLHHFQPGQPGQTLLHLLQR